MDRSIRLSRTIWSIDGTYGSIDPQREVKRSIRQELNQLIPLFDRLIWRAWAGLKFSFSCFGFSFFQSSPFLYIKYTLNHSQGVHVRWHASIRALWKQHLSSPPKRSTSFIMDLLGLLTLLISIVFSGWYIHMFYAARRPMNENPKSN